MFKGIPRNKPTLNIQVHTATLSDMMDTEWQDVAIKLVNDAKFSIKAYPILIRYLHLLAKGGTDNEKEVAKDILNLIDRSSY